MIAIDVNTFTAKFKHVTLILNNFKLSLHISSLK